MHDKKLAQWVHVLDIFPCCTLELNHSSGLTRLTGNTSKPPSYLSQTSQASLTTAPLTTEFPSFDVSFPTESSWLTSPVMYGITGGVGVLGIILMTYMCYKCCYRSRPLQLNMAGATSNLSMSRMVQLPSQFPIGASCIYQDKDTICLVNQD